MTGAYGGPARVTAGAFSAADVHHVVADSSRAHDGLGFSSVGSASAWPAVVATTPLQATR